MTPIVAKKAIRRLVAGKMEWINAGTEFTPASQEELDSLTKADAIYPSKRAAAAATRAMEGVRQAEGVPPSDPDAERLAAERAAAILTRQESDAAARIAAEAAKKLADDEAAKARTPKNTVPTDTSKLV
jgi:hypothetical protein